MSEPNPSQLPALVPSAALVLRRTQTTQGLLRDVVQESSAEYWFRRGRAAEAEDQWAEAAHTYRQCVERDAEHWRAWVRLAGAFGQLGQAEDAAGALNSTGKISVAWDALVAELPNSAWQLLRDCLEAARSTARDSYGLLIELSQVYRVLKQGKQARRTLNVMEFMYQQQVAGSAQWFKMSALLYNDAKLHTKAIDDCNRAIELSPDDGSSYGVRGMAKAALLDCVGAITDYNQAINFNPIDAPTYNNRGIAKVEIGDFNGAVADYNRAIELNLDFPMAHSNRGDAKIKLKDYAGAIADYDEFIELKPNYAFAYRKRGSAKYDLLTDVTR